MAARITRFDSAPRYSPPLHDGVEGRRLQGLEAGPTEAFWVGYSLYPPGASSQLAPTVAETVYYIIAGDLALTLEEPGGATTTNLLHRGDSVHLPQGTTRRVVNQTGENVEVLVAIANPVATP